jgi:hypothetical protein
MFTASPAIGLDTIVTRLGNVGIGDEAPTANLSIRAREATVGILTPLAWYRAEDYDGTTTWTDHSGNGYHMTAHGSTSAGVVDGIRPVRTAPTGTNSPTGGSGAHSTTTLYGVDTNIQAGPIRGGWFQWDSLALPPLNPVANALGITICLIIKDWGFASTGGNGGSDYLFGTGVVSNSVLNRVFVDPGGQSDVVQGDVTNHFYSNLQSHTPDNNVLDYWVLLTEPGTVPGQLLAYLNGTVCATGTGPNYQGQNNFTFAKFMNLGGAGWAPLRGRSICECIIFNRRLNTAEIATVNSYFANRIVPGSSGSTTPLTHWKNVSGVVDSIVDENVNFGIGTASPAQKLHVVGKAILQNSSSAFKATLDASSLTADATFDFVDPASSPAIIVTGTGNLNALTIWGAGSGGNVTYTSALNFDGAVGNRQLQIGDAAIATTPGIKIFAQSPYTTTYTLSSTTGVVTFDTPSAGGRYVFTGNTSSEIATFTGGNGIKADKYNRVEITTPTTGSTLTILDTMTVTFDKSLEFDGTSGTKMTFPSTNATIARTDAAQTFTGVQTFSSQDVHTLGIDLSTSGAIVASVANSGTNVGLLVRNTVGLTASRRMFEVDWWTGSAYQEAFGVWSQAGSVKGMQLSYDTSNYLRTTVTSGGSTTILNQGAGSLTFNTSTGNIQFTSAGSIQFSPVTSITFNTLSALLADGLVISNVANVTGLKIGAAADKLGFYSVAPVVQPVNTVAIDTALTNLGLRATGGLANFDTDIKAAVVGKGLYVKEGANATMGLATLVAGVAVVATTKVTANSRIFLTRQTVAGTVGTSVDVTARTAATSFTITAAGSILDTSTVAWLIMEPA